MKIILASQSPRRKALLEQIGIAPLVYPSDFTESTGGDMYVTLKANTIGKALSVRDKFSDNDLIIAADTVVHIEGQVLGKPGCDAEALAMLKALSGKKHQVLTGVAVCYRNKIQYEFAATDVYMKQSSDEELRAYIATGEPKDKAGAYGIQGKGAIFVEKIEGCYNNVVGLPIFLLNKMISDIK